ncbi:hypothetical protein [Halorussus sp. AFM4]|uniref:hypothetical protein n=1 Tax=Halorussus sp. AFM4 TaxID=3421651 RepID=UPI003EBA7885
MEKREQIPSLFCRDGVQADKGRRGESLVNNFIPVLQTPPRKRESETVFQQRRKKRMIFYI